MPAKRQEDKKDSQYQQTDNKRILSEGIDPDKSQ